MESDPHLPRGESRCLLVLFVRGDGGREAHQCSASKFKFETRSVEGANRCRESSYAVGGYLGPECPAAEKRWRNVYIKEGDNGKFGRYKTRNRGDPIGAPVGRLQKGKSGPRCRTPICYRTAIYDRGTFHADPTPNMDTRNPFSRLKKKVKRLGNKQKQGRTGADFDRESVGPDNPLPQSEPHIVVDDRERNGTNKGVQQASTMDQPPQLYESEVFPADGGESDQGVGEADVGGRKVSPMYLHLHSDVEARVGSRPCQGWNGGAGEENGEVYCPSSSLLVLHSGDPNGMLIPQ